MFLLVPLRPGILMLFVNHRWSEMLEQWDLLWGWANLSRSSMEHFIIWSRSDACRILLYRDRRKKGISKGSLVIVHSLKFAMSGISFPSLDIETHIFHSGKVLEIRCVLLIPAKAYSLFFSECEKACYCFNNLKCMSNVLWNKWLAFC